MSFTREQLESYRDCTVPDLLGENCKLLFVGINPGLWTAATQTHFCHPSNRFYPALRIAGVIGWDVDTSTGLSDGQRSKMIEAGIGITNIVARATVRASELTREELRAGAANLSKRVKTMNPTVVAVAGVTAYRTAYRQPKAEMGRQPETIGDSEVWVVPNASGLNAHETVDSLAVWYGKAARAAGLL